MNDDALAAIAAAAKLLQFARTRRPAPPPAARWLVADRLHPSDVSGARLASRARSRWNVSDRIHD